MITFSLVMPCGPGSEKTVKKAISSIVDQDYEDWELVCVINGQWEGKKKLIRAINKFRSDGRVSWDEADQANVCLARNQGAMFTDGKYLSFFSSDFYMFPGCLRKWKQAFEETGADVVYGGYQLMENGDLKEQYVPSQPWDPRQLECEPYIDGGFPVKRKVWEKVKWDPKCKSLNDWDWTVGIAKAGFRGYMIPDFTYAAEVPKEGGLSFDSHKNWLERVDWIKKKHGIPQRDICVVSLGAAPHGKKLARILDADFKTAPQVKAHRYKLIYLIGFFLGDGSSAYRHSHVFRPENAANKNFKKAVHWIGTDVLQMLSAANSHNVTYAQMFMLIDGLNKMKNFTEFQQTWGEMQTIGLETEILPLPVEDRFGFRPLPKKFSVAVYAPATKTATTIYNLELMKDIVKSCPDIKFIFYGGGSKDFKAKNVENLGWTDMGELINKSSCLLRFPIHDGLPIAPIEFRMSGRDSITSVQLPHIYFAGSGMVNSENYAQKKELLIKAIRDVKKDQKKKSWKKDAIKARKYWISHCDLKKYKKRIYEFMDEKENDAKDSKSSRRNKKGNRRKKR